LKTKTIEEGQIKILEPQKKGDKIQKINDTKDRRLKTKKKVDEDLRQKNIEDIRLT
jgi:hypothetical protein